MPNDGLCQCGCGEKTTLIKRGNKRNGIMIGQHHRFILGHSFTHGLRENHNNWKGGRMVDDLGRVRVYFPSHPRSQTNHYVFEHILIAEKALGMPLPKGAVVHHINGDRGDNRKENLIICQDQAYHNRLHHRQRALVACGNPNWFKCSICHKYDSIENLRPKQKYYFYHINCQRIYRQRRKAALSVV